MKKRMLLVLAWFFRFLSSIGILAKKERLERLNQSQNVPEYQCMIVSYDENLHGDNDSDSTVVSLAEGMRARRCIDSIIDGYVGGYDMLHAIDYKTGPARFAHLLDRSYGMEVWAFVCVRDDDFILKDWFNEGRNIGTFIHTRWGEWRITEHAEQYYMDHSEHENDQPYDTTYVMNGFINVTPPNFGNENTFRQYQELLTQQNPAIKI